MGTTALKQAELWKNAWGSGLKAQEILAAQIKRTQIGQTEYLPLSKETRVVYYTLDGEKLSPELASFREEVLDKLQKLVQQEKLPL